MICILYLLYSEFNFLKPVNDKGGCKDSHIFQIVKACKKIF